MPQTVAPTNNNGMPPSLAQNRGNHDSPRIIEDLLKGIKEGTDTSLSKLSKLILDEMVDNMFVIDGPKMKLDFQNKGGEGLNKIPKGKSKKIEVMAGTKLVYSLSPSTRVDSTMA